MGVSRKLKVASQAMDSMMAREDLVDFLNNPENSLRLNGLVEDVRCALMDYQVCTSKRLTLTVSDILLRPHYNETSVMKTVSLL